MLGILTSIGLDHKELLGDTKDEILLQKLGIMQNKIPGMVGPGVNFNLANRYCERKGVPFHTIKEEDHQYFMQSDWPNKIPTNPSFMNNNLHNNFLNAIKKIKSENRNSSFLKCSEARENYLLNQSYLNSLDIQSINKMICKGSLDILKSYYGLNIDYDLPHFENLNLRGRCEEIKPGQEFR